MKKIIMTMAAVSALSIGAPAAAQYMGGDVHARVQQLQIELQTGVRNGSISRREAMPLGQQIREITQLERQYGRDGMSGRERNYLQQRIANLRQHIRYAQQMGGGRYDRADGYVGNDRYGQNDRYDRDGRFDSNRDGFDDRDLDRNGRLDDGRYGDDDGGYLRVGQRISGDFDVMPDQYRDRYRDGGGSYYRYDEGNIYQVDARTNLILRIISAGR